jgi:osmoprotectant transport system ATP-binding protein
VLLGPSGCGKTTLLKMINRLYEPTSGKIFIGGSEVHDLPATELRRRIGYVIQQVGLFPHMSIERNISVVPSILGWERRKTNERVNWLLDMVGLPQEYRHKYPHQLSGGEQQRVGLARALAADPGILLMDEPFAAVDAINRKYLQDELLAIHRKVHKTILFVTHDVEEAFRLADKIAIMKEGRLIQFGTPLQIVTTPQNAFIEDLVGAHNMLRKLSLIDVQSVLAARARAPSQGAIAPLHPSQAATVRPEDDLRSVLAQFLVGEVDALQVVDANGRQVGMITFSDLRAALVENIPQSQALV